LNYELIFMTRAGDVQVFLNEFHQKLQIWQILFRDDRKKNFNALLNLDISSAKRKQIITALETIDYSEGPITDTLNDGTALWVFGKIIKGTMVYIKITMGQFNNPVICISFHEAEHEMNFPFKNYTL
jgi:hypothetical protein